ncbi:gamma-aminobutyric acid type B receptor subunit 2-like [Haliotis asinina]|uniref:gamma-aminobutyric acid type B receptor subunit 2-like n=1 Tax=Haliotis asinina TaxID=109174 RepID=UPI003531BC5D
MTFGALFAKTWRVHVIFRSQFMVTTNKVYKDWSLFLLVGVLVLVNSGILLAWILTDSITVTHHTQTPHTLTESDVVIQPIVSLCSSTKIEHYVGSILAVQGTLLLYGAFLAWETRKVHVDVLNDSGYIGVCIYNTVVMTVMAVIVCLSLRKEVLVYYLVESTISIFTTTVTQMLIFVPKVKAYRNHKNHQKRGVLSRVNFTHDMSQFSCDGAVTVQGSCEYLSEVNTSIQGSYPDSKEDTEASHSPEQYI